MDKLDINVNIDKSEMKEISELNNHKYQVLFNIKSPQDIKKMSLKELNALSQLIREFIIDAVSEHGGHLSSNLGTIEAIIAMHYVFNSPKDKFIFDVGHQAYTHKILTGRAKDFVNLRKINGLSGFPKSSESEHDVFEAGHSSTAISAMCGFLEAKKSNDSIGEVISFVGDASIQSGISLAGINYLAGKKDQKGIIIINDNEMSISRNTGGLTNIFNKIRVKKSYSFFRKITPKPIRNALKSLIYGKITMFTQLGYRYIGPIDGHNIKELIKYYEFAKNSKDSVIIHIKTTKGKGYELAENDKTGIYHGLGPFEKETGKTLCENKTFSDEIGKIIENVITENPKIRIITPAMTYGTGLSEVNKKYHDKIIDVGICEENAVIMASSMEKSGLIPIVMTYSTFFQRAYDEINHDVTRTNSHVIFMADRADLVPGDGNTHQGIFDLSMLLSLPNLSIATPSTIEETKEILNIAITNNGPFYIRYQKSFVSNMNINLLLNNLNITYGKWNIIWELQDINIISYGNKLLKLKEELIKNNLENKIGLINALFIKPIDIELISKLEHKYVLIYEEVIETNSLASIIKCYNNDNHLDINIEAIGLNDYVETGSISELEKEYHLDPKTVVQKIENKLREK